MTTSLLAGLTIAGILGVTHAIEPDHVAGISALTSEYADSRRSILAGACFALGHVGLVVCWVFLGYVLLGRSTFPAVFDRIGSVGVGVILGVLGAVMASGGSDGSSIPIPTSTGTTPIGTRISTSCRGRPTTSTSTAPGIS